MLKHDINSTVQEGQTESQVKFIKVLKKPASELSDAADLAGESSSASKPDVTTALNVFSSAPNTKAAATDRRPGGGCIPVSGMDRQFA